MLISKYIDRLQNKTKRNFFLQQNHKNRRGGSIARQHKKIFNAFSDDRMVNPLNFRRF